MQGTEEPDKSAKFEGRDVEPLSPAKSEPSWKSPDHVTWKAAANRSHAASKAEEQTRWAHRALRLFRNSPEVADPAAITALILQIHLGAPVEAEALARVASEAGNVHAMGVLASLTAARNPDESRLWEARACDGGDPNALYLRAVRLLDVDRTAAVEALRAAAQRRNRFAMECLGIEQFRHGRQEAGLKWLERAIESGSKTALYERCRLTYALNPIEAEAGFLEAAEAGVVLAMRFLADVYARTKPPKSTYWLDVACAYGDEQACELRALDDRASQVIARLEGRLVSWYKSRTGFRLRSAPDTSCASRPDIVRVTSRMRSRRVASSDLSVVVAEFDDTEVAVACAEGRLRDGSVIGQSVILVTIGRVFWTVEKPFGVTVISKDVRDLYNPKWNGAENSGQMSFDLAGQTLQFEPSCKIDGWHLYWAIRRYSRNYH